jgi:acetyl esterase/lipase
MIKNIILLTVLLGFATMSAIGAESLHDSSVLLWPDGAPEAQGTERKDQPGLTIHLPPKEKATGAAIVVNPGGGFRKLASDNEGLHVARWLNSFGVAAFVTRYRLLPDYQPDVSIRDGQRAIRYVRHNADAFGIDPKRIGVMGFSAGGHLASGAAVRFDSGNPEASDPINRVSSRPDFAMLMYAGIAEELLELATANVPPTFFVLSHEDSLISASKAFQFYEALREQGVPAEMHIFGQGAHGTGMAPGDPSLGQWPTILAKWLKTSGFLTGSERIAVKGAVTIDGGPLAWGGIALIPEDPNAPIVWTHSAGGEFSIDAAHGPVPGPHRAEVHILSKDLSNLQSGYYTTDGSESYIKSSPNATGSLMVEIVSRKDIQIDIATE